MVAGKALDKRGFAWDSFDACAGQRTVSAHRFTPTTSSWRPDRFGCKLPASVDTRRLQPLAVYGIREMRCVLLVLPAAAILWVRPAPAQSASAAGVRPSAVTGVVARPPAHDILGTFAAPAVAPSPPRAPRRGRFWRYALTGAYVGTAAGAVYGVREAYRCDCGGGIGSPWFLGPAWAGFGGLAGLEAGSLVYLVSRLAGR